MTQDQTGEKEENAMPSMHAGTQAFTPEDSPADATGMDVTPNEFRPYAYHRGPSPYGRQDGMGRLVQTLGWFSVGLGLAQLIAPQRMSRAIGADSGAGVMRAVGARELASGVGILTQRRPTGWLWSRVAGDAMDLALLGTAARRGTNARSRIGIAGAAVAGIAVLDLLTSMKSPEHQALGSTVELEKTIIINRTPDECYRFWRDLEGLPRFMRHLDTVEVVDERVSHWVAKGPFGYRVEWNSELYADEAGQFLAWRSVEGSEVDTEGSVRFERAPGGRGTLANVWMRYRPPGGAAGALVAKMFGSDPAQQIDEDLRRFKWLLETGEIPTTVGQPSGPRGIWNRYVVRRGAAG